MKTELRKEARRLRAEDGISVREISRRLQVSKGSVSLWVRDIRLTAEQDKKLQDKNPFCNGQNLGAKIKSQRCRQARLSHQDEGREKARSGSDLHRMGCMLYWAEGSKNKNVLTFSNTDPAMMVLFCRFLRNEIGIPDSDMQFSTTVYLNNDLSLDEIESYWLDLLSLPRSCLRRSTVNRFPKSSQKKTSIKHLYGVARLTVCQTSAVQHVFGAIQEYGNFSRKEWLQ